MAEQGLTSFQPIANRTLPQWLLPHLHPSKLKTTSIFDLILVLHKMKIFPHKRISVWHNHLPGKCTLLKYCYDTQLQNARVQHSWLDQWRRAQGRTHIKVHTILLGVVEMIYKGHSDIPLNGLGLDHSKIKKSRTQKI